MQKLDQQETQRLHDVQRLLDDRKAELPSTYASGARQKLDGYGVLLDAHDSVLTEKRQSAQSATKTAQGIAEALYRDILSPMVRVALAEIPNVPELRPFSVRRRKVSTLRIASDARGMAKAAAPYQEVFTHAGLPADFLARLATDAEAIGAAVTERNSRQTHATEAGKGVKATLRAAARTIHVLDGFVRSEARGNAPLIAAWERARRIRRVTTTSSAPVIAPANATPAVAVPAAAAPASAAA